MKKVICVCLIAILFSQKNIIAGDGKAQQEQSVIENPRTLMRDVTNHRKCIALNLTIFGMLLLSAKTYLKSYDQQNNQPSSNPSDPCSLWPEEAKSGCYCYLPKYYPPAFDDNGKLKAKNGWQLWIGSCNHCRKSYHSPVYCVDSSQAQNITAKKIYDSLFSYCYLLGESCLVEPLTATICEPFPSHWSPEASMNLSACYLNNTRPGHKGANKHTKLHALKDQLRKKGNSLKEIRRLNQTKTMPSHNKNNFRSANHNMVQPRRNNNHIKSSR